MNEIFVFARYEVLNGGYAFLVTALLCWIIIATGSRFALFVDDPNKSHGIHVGNIPRVGGIAVFIGFVFGVLEFSSGVGDFYGRFLLVLLPVFLIGIAEDIARNISANTRILFAFISALLSVVLLDVRIERVDIGWLDLLLKYPFISISFTVFAFIGMSQAINIVDGLNGLSSMVSMMILCGIFAVAAKVNDVMIMEISICLIASLAGFFVFNFPKGKIFLGDGGAYFVGAAIAVLLIYLVQQHARISPWFALVLTFYPVCETLYTILRRLINKFSPILADRMHLHTLVFNISALLVSTSVPTCRVTRMNYMASIFLWILGAGALIGSVFNYNATWNLVGFACVFAIIYYVLYKIALKYQPPFSKMINMDGSVFTWVKFHKGAMSLGAFPADQGHEYCVLCGSRTGTLVLEDVKKRLHYIEGAGQLCARCHQSIQS